jgi:DNA mismatch repair protein MSH2
VPDLDVIGSKLATEQSSSVSLEDLVRVYETVVVVNCLVDDLKGLKSENLNSLVVVPLEHSVRNMEGFMRLVESTLDLEAASKNDFRIDSKFDPSLATISQNRESVLKEIEKLRSQIEKSIDNVKIVECLAPYAMAFRVSRKQMASVQSLGSKYKQVQINKAEYLFTSSALMERVEELQSVESEYQKKASAVVKKIVSVASSYHAVVSSLAHTVGILDVLTSFAVAASMCKLTRPLTDVHAPLNLKRCRHLLVEIRSLELTGMDYIPNDVFMTRESNCQIITGPNMGGKSTYIRSVALAVLMNQIGCFVPCDQGSSLPIFDSIMCRVGASDAQVRGVSTFMQEMIEAATIVNSATSRSLVIVDELGRGTSTQDGFGLAWAIAKHLKDVSNSFVFFATHFHELSQLPGAANRHVAAAVNETGLTLLYEVRDGPTSNSFGPNVAALAGYPAQVVQDAIAREKTLVLEASYRVNLDAVRE